MQENKNLEPTQFSWRVISYGLRVMGNELRVTGNELRVKGYALRVGLPDLPAGWQVRV